MSDTARTWAYRPRHSARVRRGTLVWAVVAAIRFVLLAASLLVVFAGLTVGVGYVVVHHLAGLVTGR